MKTTHRKPQITRTGAYEIIDNMIEDLQEIKANYYLEYILESCGRNLLKPARNDILKLKHDINEHEIAADVAFGR